MSSEIAMFTAAAYFTTQNLDDAYLALMSIANHFLDFPLQWPAKSVMRLAFNSTLRSGCSMSRLQICVRR